MSALVHYSSPRSLTLPSLLDEFFNDEIFNLHDRDISRASWPRVDITEDKNAYHLKADLPGITRDDITVNVEKGVLSITGEKKEEKREREKDRYYHYERSYGRFSRTFNLPEDVNANDIEAAYSNGVLNLTLKKDEKAKPKAIDIKVKQG